MISSGLNLVMTVIGFGVSIMFIVFVFTRLICTRIQLNASRRSLPIASRSDFSLLERGFQGLEPIAIANFPTTKYCDEFFAAAEDAQCSICLSEYHCGDTLRILPYCGHSFHLTCIDVWLQQHSTCPVCRISQHECPERKRLLQPLFSSAVRSHYSHAFDRHSYNLLTGCGFSSRSLVNQRMDPVQEHHFSSEGDRAEAANNTSTPTEAHQTITDSMNKQVESPSNT